MEKTKELTARISPMKYPKELNKLIEWLKKFPGVGRKSAERYAFDLLKWNERELQDLGLLISKLKLNLTNCVECGCLIQQNAPCRFCENPREAQSLCIVSSAKDVFTIEETHTFKGYYHVIPHVLSPLDSQQIHKSHIEQIKTRIQTHGIREVILALDATIEGDATSLFLKQQIQDQDVLISRLALGIPIGSSLDFVDEGTLSRAFSGRNAY